MSWVYLCYRISVFVLVQNAAFYWQRTCRLVLVTLLPRILTRRGTVEGSPSYLASVISDYVPFRSLRSSDKLLLSRPYMSLVMADKALSVSAPKIWNDLSFNCRAATCVSSFQCSLKRELFLHRVRWSLPVRVAFRRVTNWFCICICIFVMYNLGINIIETL